MPISLKKGQKVSLTKENPGLKNVVVGIGWDINAFDTGGDFDLDAAAFCLTDSGKVSDQKDFVFYGNLTHPSGAIQHMGDNLTGAGEGDDEQIFVDLNSVPNDVGCIVFAVNIYEAFKRNQHFGMIRNAFIRVVDYDRGVELCRFNLSENYANQTALIAGDIIRTPDGWEFRTDGTAARVESLVDVVSAFAE